MSSAKNSFHGLYNDGVQKESSDVFERRISKTHIEARKGKEEDKFNYSQDQKPMELYSQARMQKEEIQNLRQQIAVACVKVVEDERYVFTSSMLGLLAEYGLWPHVTNASALSGAVKHLHDQLQWKIRSSYDRIRETSQAGNHAGTVSVDTDSPGSDPLTSQLFRRSTVVLE